MSSSYTICLRDNRLSLIDYRQYNFAILQFSLDSITTKYNAYVWYVCVYGIWMRMVNWWCGVFVCVWGLHTKWRRLTKQTAKYELGRGTSVA